jgi:hypothetical protein
VRDLIGGNFPGQGIFFISMGQGQMHQDENSGQAETYIHFLCLPKENEPKERAATHLVRLC